MLPVPGLAGGVVVGGAGLACPAAKVLPMGPNLMLEYVTYAFGEAASTWVGTPDVVAQVPRATPGAVAGLVVG